MKRIKYKSKAVTYLFLFGLVIFLFVSITPWLLFPDECASEDLLVIIRVDALMAGVFLGLPLLLVIFWNSAICIDEEGLKVCRFKKEMAVVPWTAITGMRYIKGTPKVCILFQELGYIYHGESLYLTDKLRYSVFNDEIICESAAIEVYSRNKPPESFLKRPIYGLTLTENQYEQIHEWWLKANSFKE